jgi:polysaccharide biosynthesis protein PslG
VLGIIDYCPAWANGGRSSNKYPPLYPSDYGAFAGSLATYFAPLGVHAWEIWNEPNLSEFWMPAANPAYYVQLLQHAYTALKRVDPLAVVITGGLSQHLTSNLNVGVLDFLRAIYTHGGRGFFDAVANHPYDSPRLPSEGYNWRQMFGTSPSMLSIMEANGDGGKRIWITEIGAPTSGIDPYGTVVSEARQAEILSQAYALAATSPWAGPVFWYNLQDYCPWDPAREVGCFYGIVRYDGSGKAAAEALRAVPA